MQISGSAIEETKLSDVVGGEHVGKVVEDTTIPAGEKPEESVKVATEEQTTDSTEEKVTEGPLEADTKEQSEDADIKKSTDKPLGVAGEDQPALTDERIITEEPLKAIDVEQAAVEKSTEDATVAGSVVEDAEKSTVESKIDAVKTETANLDSEKSLEAELKPSSDEVSKEPAEAKVELGEASKEPSDELQKPLDSTNSVAAVTSTDECKSVGADSSEAMPAHAGPPMGPTSPPPQQQPRPSMARPPGPPGQRMGAPRMGGPRMGGPRMAGPRMAGPRQAGPQKPPESAPFSGFMSMFSTPTAPSKPSAVGGFFSSSPGSLFGSSPAPRQPQQQPRQQPPQQKSSFFGLTSSIGADTITSDLFGIFKGPETTKSEEQQQPVIESEQKDPSEQEPVSESTEKTQPEKTSSSEDGQVSTEDAEVPEKGLVEEAERLDKTEAEEGSLTESTTKTAPSGEETEKDEHTEHLEEQASAVPDKTEPPPAPDTKSLFEIPGLSTPKFGFMSAASEGTSSIGSLFSTSPSPATSAKAPQPQQTDGGLFSGFKNLSAGIFQDEKPTGKDEPSSASSVFGMKFGSMFGSAEPPKAETPPLMTIAEPTPQSPKPTEDLPEPESDKPSPGSEETGSADASDTEGPTETSKTGSCDTLAQSLQSGLPSQSVSLAEDLEKPQLKISPCEVDKVEETPHNAHADLGTEQPKDLLTTKEAKRLVEFI